VQEWIAALQDEPIGRDRLGIRRAGSRVTAVSAALPAMIAAGR
jgi:hypothetical protein